MYSCFYNKILRHKFTLPLVIIIVAGLLAIGISNIGNNTKVKSNAAEVTKVRVINVPRASNTINITTQGKVFAAERIDLVSEVTGKLIYSSQNTYAGGDFNKDEIIANIDPTEYQHKLQIEIANLRQAELELQEEQGRQIIAQAEWELRSNKHQHRLTKELGLRIAYIKQKEVALEAAKSKVALAELQLEKTIIKSPCNGKLLSESVAIGKMISPGENLGEFACLDSYQILTSVPQSLKQWLLDGEKLDLQVTTKIFDETVKIISILPQLDDNSKMLQLLIESHNQQLFIGNIVNVEFISKPIIDSYKIPISALKPNQSIWYAKDDKLRIMPIKILAKQQQEFIIKDLNLPNPLSVITQYINSPLDGQKIQVIANGK